MSDEVKPAIEGLAKYEKLKSVPEEALRIRRRSQYDQVIEDAKNSPIKLTLDSDKRATSAYLALRSRIKKDKEKLEVRKKGQEVYVFATKLAKSGH